MEETGCLSCGRGFHHECHQELECPHPSFSFDIPPSIISKDPKELGYNWKDAKDVKDPRSTMRRRAQAILKETRGIEIGSPCEWKGLAEIGGGRHPIVGCRDGKVAHVHHGPDKDWYNNSPGNISGVCNYCHNRWHARNDICYDPSIQSFPRQATEEELKEWNDGNKQPKVDHSGCST